MTVNRTKILIKDDNISGNTINIPIRMDFTPIDNSELVETKFVEDEIEKAINPIVDYKKIIFKPADNDWNIINEFEYIFISFGFDIKKRESHKTIIFVIPEGLLTLSGIDISEEKSMKYL